MRSLPLIVALCCAAAAQARPLTTPYSSWADQAKRADAAGLSALAKRDPASARVWFFGQIFDLGEPRIPADERARLRPRLQVVAEASGDPLLLRWLATPELGARRAAIDGMREAWLANSRAGDPTSPMLASVQRPEIAPPAFYRYLYRAGIVAGGLGAVDAADLPLATARHLAAGRAVITGQFDWWRDLAAFHGGAVPPSGPTDADDGLTRTLNARIAGDQRRVMQAGKQALHDARRRRPNSLYTALVLQLGAMAAGWGGDRRTERTLRVQVLQQVRPLKQVHLTAALLAGLIRLELNGTTPDAAGPYLEELLALGPPVRQRRPIAGMLVDALGLLETRIKALTSRADLPALAQALALYFELVDAVRDPQVIAFAPAALRASLPVRAAQARAQAGRIAWRRGLFDEAEKRLITAARALDAIPAQRAAGQAAAIDRAEVLWAAGREGDARAAITAVIANAEGVVRARARAVLGGLRLAGGDPAPAFAHANAGLRDLRGVKAPAERAALHRLAALALHATGFQEAAVERLATAAGLQPGDRHLARLLAVARLDQGDVTGALRAVEAVAAPYRAALEGCILARSGRSAEALQSLGALGALGQPHQAWALLEGLICQVDAQARQGDATQARATLQRARALALQVPAPTLEWRLRALEGADFAARKAWLDAAGVWRQALLGLGDLGAETPARGALLDMRSLAPPARPVDLTEPLIDALVQAAQAEPKSATSHLEAALAVALQARQLAAAPRRSGLHEARFRPAADRAGRRLMARLGALRRALADPAVAGADRARLTQHLATLKAALTSARARLARDARPWASYLAPQPAAPTTLQAPAGEARIYYHLGEQAGHVFVSVPGAPLRHWPLPGRAAVAQALAPAFAVITDPAQPADWAALAAPVAAVMPFLDDRRFAPLLKGLTWWVVPDGPLMSFPFEALVVDPAGPVFLADRWPVRRAASAQQATPVPKTAGVGAIGAADKETRGILEAAGARGAPSPANPATFQADFAARGTQWITVPADLGAGVLSLTGAQAGRLDEADLAFGPGGVEGVVLSRATAPLDAGAGVRRMLAALLHRGVKASVWVIGRNDADVAFGIGLAGRVGQGASLAEALRAAQAAARAGADKHPHRWARWLLAEPLPLKALRR